MDYPDFYYPEFITEPKIQRYFWDGYPKDCIIVDLSGEEYAVCDAASNHMACNYKKGTYGRGMANTKDDKRRVERTGLLGQMGLAKLIHEPCDLKYRPRGDEQDFLVLDKFKLDVKCACYDYKCNLIKKMDEEGKPQIIDKHIYISSYMQEEDRKAGTCQIHFVGFFTLNDVLKSRVARGRKGSHINYEIYFRNARPITSFVSRILKEKLTRTNTN